jgi:hypothetical protein
MGALDLEEVKDAFSRQDAAYRLLEQSARELVRDSEQRAQHVEKEKESLLSKIAQLEILLKSRQGALVAKERECEKLRSSKDQKPIPHLTFVGGLGNTVIEASEDRPREKTNSVWLSTCVGVGRFSKMRDESPAPRLRTSQTRPSIIDRPHEEHRSPPTTVFRRDREQYRSPDSSVSPRRILPLSASSSSSSLRRVVPRESFTSVRSSRTIRSLSDKDSATSSSDESLNELVSNAMRLSAASFRSSASSSFGRVSVDSARSSSFPKRWK